MLLLYLFYFKCCDKVPRPDANLDCCRKASANMVRDTGIYRGASGRPSLKAPLTADPALPILMMARILIFCLSDAIISLDGCTNNPELSHIFHALVGSFVSEMCYHTYGRTNNCK